MSHNIDFTLNRPAIAYAGETPWHGLGSKLDPDADIETWTQAAGLNWSVQDSLVRYIDDQDVGREMPSRRVLYRSDTKDALSVVGNGYRVVQPSEVMDFIGQLIKLGGFKMDVAGALSGGKRIWALAKVGDDAPIVGHDVVRPYCLIGTSYDGTMSTIAKLTAIRVVCNNTITAAVGRFDGTRNTGKTEDDIEQGAVKTLVRVPHMRAFNPDAVRQELGIFAGSFEKWTIQTKLLAERELDLSRASELTARILSASVGEEQRKTIKESRGYKRVMELFDGEAIGSDIDGGHTMWRLLNSITQYVDWERGRSASTRINAAWFGAGDGLKSYAYQTLMEAI